MMLRWLRRVGILRFAGSAAGSVRRRRVLAVARKEVRQLLRDRLTLGFVVGVPAVQLLLFGYAIEQDVRDVSTVVVDHSGSGLTRELVEALEATQTFEVVRDAGSEQEARDLLRRGVVQSAIVIPGDYTANYYRGRGAEVLILVDATDPTRARAVRAAAEGLMQHRNERLQQFQVQAPLTLDGSATDAPAVRSPRQRTSFGTEPELVRGRFLRFAVLDLNNPELRTPVFVVPALLGVILTTTMILMTALSLVRERERGTFEFLIATPVGRGELMVGKLLPYVGIGFLQVLIVVTAGLAFFRVPVKGSLLDLAVASFVFIAANLTLGLVISSTVASQFQATQASFFFFLPSVLLSGFMFPFDAMPLPAQLLGEILPLTHYIRCCRGILLRGSNLLHHTTEITAMTAFAVAGFWLATRLFRKRLG